MDLQYEEDISMKLLRLFEEWQIKKEKIWQQIGIHIDKKYDSPYAISFCLCLIFSRF